MPKKKKIQERVKEGVVNLDERMKKYRFYKEIVKDALLMLPLIGSFGGGTLRWAYNSFKTYTQRSLEAAESVARSTGATSVAPPAIQESSWLMSGLEMGWFLCIVLLICVLSWRAWKLILKLIGRFKNDKKTDE